MRFSTVFALVFASIAIAAPVDLAVREADAEAVAAPAPEAAAESAPEADGYGSYGTYAPPAGGYGRYYISTQLKMGHTTNFNSYGSYDGAGTTNPPSPNYGSYAPYGYVTI
jgi:hypothetical protein